MATEIYKGTEGKIYIGETTTTDVTKIPVDSGISLTSPSADNLIGRVESFTVRLENNVEEYFGTGSRDATDIKEGLRRISGTLNRAVINGTLLTAVIGKDDGSSPFAITAKSDGTLSKFKLELKLAQSTNYVALIANNVKFDTWEVTVNNSGDTIIQNMDWKGIFDSAQYVGVPEVGDGV